MKSTLLRLHKHYSALASGNFEESDFNFNLGGGGSSQTGEMSPERKQLIMSDAQQNLKELEEKHPDLFGKEEKKSDPNILGKIAENKTKKTSKKK